MAPASEPEDRTQLFMSAMLWRQLKGVLQFLQSHHYPHIPNPPACKKRASVALIVRFRPSIADQASFDAAKCGVSAGSNTQRLDNFFAQPWVQQGEPEILFIKRASRVGDRWTSHVAFPGGGREPGDADDCAASVRETQEEIGIDLSADHCTVVGNLPEQVVTTWWSKVPLMVLCPYVHLVMRFDLPPMTLQPTEVKSAHWVALRALLSPHLRTFERQDVSERFFRRGNQLTRRLLRGIVGQLLFTARKLVPTESSHSRSTSDYIPSEKISPTRVQVLTSQLQRAWLGPQSTIPGQDPSLILWGLTYGVLANFLGLMPTDDPTTMWDWPTLSTWDMRFAIWVFTYNFRAQKLRSLAQPTNAGESIEGKDRVEMGGLDTRTFAASRVCQNDRGSSVDIVGEMLDGYFDRLREAIWIALAFRLGVGTLLAILVYRRWHKRRLSRSWIRV